MDHVANLSEWYLNQAVLYNFGISKKYFETIPN